jgi:hypothetical protein
MFESAFLLGDTRSSIVLQTRLGNPIENSIEAEPGEHGRRKFQRLIDKFGARWEVRCSARGRYNCAGLVFANRRTSIFNPILYTKILEDDGYRVVSDAKLLMPGDIIAYVDKELNEIIHVAIILKLERGITDSSPPIPWALSKWDSVCGEVIHNIYNTPYELTVTQIVFWTDRPIH